MTWWERLWVRLMVAQAVVAFALSVTGTWYWAALKAAAECAR